MFIKGFDKDLKCRGFQFEVGKVYDTGAKDDELKLCTNTVFHCCKSLPQVHPYYNCNDEDNRYCEIEVLGKLIEDENKCGSNKIKIVREITGDELNRLKGLERGNTGLFNTGDYNTGNMNTGNLNSGYNNTGNMNTGDYNTGNMNTGNLNSGYNNTGNMNTGNLNSGYNNTGYRNTDDWNTGNMNSGYRNTGDMNSGNWNTGTFNKCNYSNGFFNTKEPTVNIFNVDSGMTASEFYNSKYYDALISSPFILTEWIKDESKGLIGGYLIEYTFEEACKNWWNKMSDNDKEIIKSIPNFNADIFKEITGIEVE